MFVAADYEVLWCKMRQKFGKLNLKRSRNEFITQDAENWYKYLTFLEPFISHKGGKVFLTPQWKEVVNEVYDELMEYEGEEVQNVEDLARRNDDNAGIEDVAMFDGYEEIITNDIEIPGQFPNLTAQNDQDNIRNPLPCVINNFKESKPVTHFSRIRARSDAASLLALKQIKDNIIDILLAAVMESTDKLIQELRLQVIITAIQKLLNKD